MTSDTMSRDVLTDPFPEAQAAITVRLEEILDACQVKDFDRLAAYHLTGPKFSKFDDVEPLDRQDDETGMRSEVEQFSAVEDLDAVQRAHQRQHIRRQARQGNREGECDGRQDGHTAAAEARNKPANRRLGDQRPNRSTQQHQTEPLFVQP